MEKSIDKYSVLADKQLLNSLIGILPDATLILNSAFEILAYNEKALQLLCKNKPNQLSECFMHLSTSIELNKDEFTSRSAAVEHETSIKDRVINLALYPVSNSSNELTNIVVFLRDITQHKVLEAADHAKTIQLNKLLETAKQLTSSLNLIDVFTRIANEANVLLKAYSSIYLLEEDGKTLKPQVVVDPVYADEIMSSTLDIDHSLTGKAIKNRKNLLFNDVGVEDDAYQIPGTSVLSNERVLITPFIVNEEVLGAMCLNRIGPIFTEEDFSLAQTLAAYASTALKNAKMYDELQKEVHERKNAEAEVKTHREQLELINKILRHDLTNHLTSVNSALKLYKHSNNDRSYLDVAEVKIAKSLELIKRMRELESFLKSHKELKVFEIRDIVDSTVKNYPGIDFQVNGFGRVLADEAISSVIDNIIGNSYIHGKANMVKVSIECSNKFCEIRISDNGCSIPDDLKETVFEESVTYGSTAQSGQGLYIVRKTIERYGGYVFLEDSIPQGTVVVFSLQSAI